MKIKALVMDVDGTLTDGKIYMSEQGELFKAFDIKDGLGIHDLLPNAGIMPIIITGRSSKILENRCAEIGIERVYQGCCNKVEKFCEIAKELGFSEDESGVYREIAYIGDDLNDLLCMRRCGVVGCPADAAEEVKKIATFASTKAGGNGAVREFIEWLTNDYKNLL